jgi:hypothetical protein
MKSLTLSKKESRLHAKCEAAISILKENSGRVAVDFLDVNTACITAPFFVCVSFKYERLAGLDVPCFFHLSQLSDLKRLVKARSIQVSHFGGAVHLNLFF